ncbi:hypothetical protein ABBQ38_009009 [Trebouxia sp. C0009 RCD-2024]
MTPETLHKMLGFGHSDKKEVDGHRPIGKYGSGFKSGSMRLGQDALVLTKHTASQSVGFLSQTFLKAAKAEEILVPMISWNLDGQRLNADADDVQQSLQAIRDYSVFQDEAGLLMQLDAIQGTGTIIIISNLRRNSAHQLELDFDADASDIRIAADLPEQGSTSPVPNYQQSRATQPKEVDVPLDYSLRQYVSVLYKVPRMQIFIREKKVKVKRMTSLLRNKIQETYRPQSNPELRCDIEMGFNTENENLYGMMLYHRNRLIRPYHRVGLQLEPNDKGLGVLGVVEADFLTPTHNKQDFDDTPAYRNMINKLGNVLRVYWWEKMDRLGKTPRAHSPLPARGGRTRVPQIQAPLAALSHRAPEEEYKVPAEAEAAKQERRRLFNAAERERKSKNKTAAELAQEEREMEVKKKQQEQQAEAAHIAAERRRLQQEQAAALRLHAEQKKSMKEEQLRQQQMQRLHQEAARQQQQAVLRAQKAEEERAIYQAAMQNLEQRNQYLQQQEAQRLADIERHRKQRLQEEQAQRAAQARNDEAQQSSVPQHSDQAEHDWQAPAAPQTRQQARGQPHNPLPDLSPKGASRSSPSRSGKRSLSVQDSANRSGSRKRQVLDMGHGDVGHAKGGGATQQHAAATAPPQGTDVDNQTTAQITNVVSEDTHSNRGDAGAAPVNDVQERDAEDSQLELVSKLARNLQMALKALSVLKGVDSTVFEQLQPADLGNLDLHTLCQTPSPTPSQ